MVRNATPNENAARSQLAILSADRSSTLEELLADTEQPLPENVVEALVGEAFSSLDVAFQQVMQVLAILGTPVPAEAVDYLLQPYSPGINSEPLLRALVNMLFVRSESGNFHLHEVDRKHALQRIPEETSVSRNANLLTFTRHSLLRRSADYYQMIRTPKESWKTIDDLTPQLAEIEARIASEEYDAAALVLLDIDIKYLLRWGHVRLVLERHEQLRTHIADTQRKESCFMSLGICYDRLGDYRHAIDLHEQCLAITRDIGDRIGEGSSLGNLGNCYYSLGDYHRAIDLHEQCLAISRDIGNSVNEGSSLGNLGICYYSLGDYFHAINLYEQALAINREIGSRYGEGHSLGNLGVCYYSLGDYHRAIDLQEQCLAITRDIDDRVGEGNSLNNLGDIYNDRQEISQALDHYQAAIKLANGTDNLQIQHEARFGLAIAHVLQGDLIAAREAIETTRKYDFPENDAAVWAITGIIRLRLREPTPAKEAFLQGLSEADTLLEQSNQNLSALETKALALCGLALCDHQAHLTTAKQTFQAARQIITAKGVVTRLLNRFDALALADTENILAPLRKIAAGE